MTVSKRLLSVIRKWLEKLTIRVVPRSIVSLRFFRGFLFYKGGTMNLLQQQLQEAILKIIKKLYDISDESLVMTEIPRDNKNGDYSSNIAMRLTKLVGKAPRDIASEIQEELNQLDSLIEKVEVAGPGFINFWMKKGSIGNIINTILEEKEAFGYNDSGSKLPILVEYVSANPTGNLHLGHARGAVWGDCITRLLNASGYDCLREYYINDSGVQMTNLGHSVFARYAEVFGESIEIPQDGYMGEDVKLIGQKIASEEGDKWLSKPEGYLDYFIKKGYEVELEKIKRDLKEFRIEFDSWVSEKELYTSGRVENVIKTMQEKGLTYEEEGALWFKSTNWGDDKDRVLVKADGNLTYLTPDIANHLYKFERGYNKLVNLWGADHHGYIARMKAAMMAYGYEGDQLEVDIIQMVRLVENGQEVKMSKRTGNAITIRELIEDIGVDAARYFFVSRAVDTHMDFDLGLARKQSNENPVFYVQYAHARICTILNQVGELNSINNFDLLTHEKEVDLLKYMAEFPGIVADAAVTRMPNKICNYVYKLAGYLHSLYGAVKIMDKDNPELMNQRLHLLQATKQVLANALDLIGVSAPEKM